MRYLVSLVLLLVTSAIASACPVQAQAVAMGACYQSQAVQLQASPVVVQQAVPMQYALACDAPIQVQAAPVQQYAAPVVVRQAGVYAAPLAQFAPSYGTGAVVVRQRAFATVGYGQPVVANAVVVRQRGVVLAAPVGGAIIVNAPVRVRQRGAVVVGARRGAAVRINVGRQRGIIRRR